MVELEEICCGNPFQNHPFESLKERWGRRFRCVRCGSVFTWGEDDADFCEHLDGMQPAEWLARGLVAPERN